MTRTEAVEVLATSAVTLALIAVVFVSLRLAFPEPAIEGSFCPNSLGQPALTDCIRSWHTSHAEREDHFLATGLGTVLIVTAAVGLIEQRLFARVSLPLALALGAGGVLIVGFGQWLEGDGVAYVLAAGLLLAGSVLCSPRPHWPQIALAITLGALSFIVTAVTFFAVFYEAP